MTPTENYPQRIIGSSHELEAFRVMTEAVLPNGCRPIRLVEQDSWHWTNGALTHVSGGYFHVVGLQRQTTDGERLLMYQPQSALTGLLLYAPAGSLPCVLLQARAEPGNMPVVQYGPTIQSTQANYLRAHGGKPTAYLEYFFGYHPHAGLLRQSHQYDLGTRYFQKSKSHHYVMATALPDTLEHFVWVPLNVMLQAALNDNLLNPDLRSLLAVYDWQAHLGHASMPAPTGLEQLYALVQRAEQQSLPAWRMVPVEKLQGWQQQPWGVVPIGGQGLGVQLYEVIAGSREVATWAQPLLTASSPGRVQQLLRRGPHGTEWLVTVDTEAAVSAVALVNASGVAYPGGDVLVGRMHTGGQPWRSIWQCDEGGRFYSMESRYEVRWVAADEVVPMPNQCWLNTAAVKQLLASSNRCSIQFRCVASLLLDELNPCLAAAG
ncbi:MAG: NDP-hexose 2,3-dehydratase family protein [Chitinophagaceae bacterium]|jgi:oxidase EvaA|nr:NDP-hexose 2,3-dehydratase family protein [Chitinophagaceae bacterium]